MTSVLPGVSESMTWGHAGGGNLGVPRRTGHQQGPALPSGRLSLQRCLIQVAFRPTLPSPLIHQEDSQALTKPVEVRPVRGGLQEEGRGGTGRGLWFPAHPPPRGSRGPGRRAAGSAGWTLWSVVCQPAFKASPPVRTASPGKARSPGADALRSRWGFNGGRADKMAKGPMTLDKCGSLQP